MNNGWMNFVISDSKFKQKKVEKEATKYFE